MSILKHLGFIPTLLGIITLTQSCFPLQTSSVKSDCIHLPLGIPKGTPVTNDFLCRDAYALSSNDQTKFADWVAYQITKEQLECVTPNTRIWKADPDIDEAETLEPSDYKGTGDAGYDRGHQAPLASFKCKEWKATNYLSNITPQRAALNRGTWKKLEEEVRSLAEQHGEVFVITGPVYDDTMAPLPGADEPHQVPSGYFKIVTIDGEHTAYYFDQNTPRGTDFETGLTTIANIERKTGINFPHR